MITVSINLGQGARTEILTMKELTKLISGIKQDIRIEKTGVRHISITAA